MVYVKRISTVDYAAFYTVGVVPLKKTSGVFEIYGDSLYMPLNESFIKLLVS